MTVSMGSILAVFDANRKSQSIKTVLTNLNLVVESLSKEMRYSTNYHCGPSGDLALPQNCPTGDSLVSFLTNDGIQIAYRKSGGAIEKSVDGGASYVAVTAPEILIDDLTFFVLGAGTANSLQPKILLKIRGRAGAAEGESQFTIQTLISQRSLDN